MARFYIAGGHGENDPGAIGNGQTERENNGIMAEGVAVVLRANGHEAKVGTRYPDTNEGIHAACNEANAWGADYAMQIHMNAWYTPDANGVEVIAYPGSEVGVPWAEKIHNNLVAFFRGRGIVQKYYTWVVHTNMPATLPEVGFITNPQDCSVVVNRPNEVCNAIVQATLKQLGVGYVPIPVPVPVAPQPVGEVEALGNGDPSTAYIVYQGRQYITLGVQQMLLVWKSDCLPKYGADGVFGSETEEAVKAFQAANGCGIDGLVGQETISKLVEATQPTPQPPFTPITEFFRVFDDGSQLASFKIFDNAKAMADTEAQARKKTIVVKSSATGLIVYEAIYAPPPEPQPEPTPEPQPDETKTLLKRILEIVNWIKELLSRVFK